MRSLIQLILVASLLPACEQTRKSSEGEAVNPVRAAEARSESTEGASTAAAADGKEAPNLLGLKRRDYDTSRENWKFGVVAPDPFPAKFDPAKDYFATIHTTFGDLTVKFFPEDAPKHVTSFINLAEIGYYDDVVFHRIIPGFMMQGGDPAGHGGGGPMYTVPAEFNKRKHVRGILSAARKGGDVDSAGSQFFVMFKPNPGLDNQYSIFGEVVDGMAVVDKFEKIGNSNPAANGKVTQLEKITSIDVFTKDKQKS